VLMAFIMAVSSPIWFDWASPGTLIAWFLSSSGPYQIPLPQHMFFFLLLKHAPSVKTCTRGCLSCILGSWWRLAGSFDSFVGSVKILKHSCYAPGWVQDVETHYFIKVARTTTGSLSWR
jgi:hypothetical protein